VRDLLRAPVATFPNWGSGDGEWSERCGGKKFHWSDSEQGEGESVRGRSGISG